MRRLAGADETQRVGDPPLPVNHVSNHVFQCPVAGNRACRALIRRNQLDSSHQCSPRRIQRCQQDRLWACGGADFSGQSPAFDVGCVAYIVLLPPLRPVQHRRVAPGQFQLTLESVVGEAAQQVQHLAARIGGRADQLLDAPGTTLQAQRFVVRRQNFHIHAGYLRVAAGQSQCESFGVDFVPCLDMAQQVSRRPVVEHTATGQSFLVQPDELKQEIGASRGQPGEKPSAVKGQHCLMVCHGRISWRRRKLRLNVEIMP